MGRRYERGDVAGPSSCVHQNTAFWRSTVRLADRFLISSFWRGCRDLAVASVVDALAICRSAGTHLRRTRLECRGLVPTTATTCATQRKEERATPDWRDPKSGVSCVSTASSTNRAYSRSAIGASNCHPRPASASHIWNYLFEVPGCAAQVLRNASGRYPLYRLIQRYGMDSMRRARSRVESRISGFVSLKYSFDA
jgi:hypothetical protein